MSSFSTLLTVFTLLNAVFAHSDRYLPVCHQIAEATSNATSVSYPTDILGHYAADISHWASSSTQFATCSVQPGSAHDIALIFPILSRTKTPFAIKGGGHTANPSFSSTPGVHISMSRFSTLKYTKATQSVVVGAGLIWDDVYAYLDKFGVNVVGGRVTGVGVAGLTLGGGYSWLTNQYGLTIDTVLEYELVKPTGEIATVTHTSDPELFFGLRGGMNNFGIVTHFTFKTFPQGPVWGGLITIPSPFIPQFTSALARYQEEVKDPKAGVIAGYESLVGQHIITLLIFYDAPTPPPGTFDDILAVPSLTKDVRTRRFVDFVRGWGGGGVANVTFGQRATFHTFSLQKYTPTMLEAVYNETDFWSKHLTPLSTSLFLSYSVEPFLSSIYSHTYGPGTESAYPPTRSPQTGTPMHIYYCWLGPLNGVSLSLFDSHFHEAIKASVAHLTSIAVSEGIGGEGGGGVYPNYAIRGTPLGEMYGSPERVERLGVLRGRVDPEGVMRFAGGWRF